MNLKTISVLAITALLVTGISGMSGVAGTPRSAPTTTTTTCLTSTSLTSLITCLVNSVGDDTFSTIDLSTLVNSVTLTTTTPLHTSTSAARTISASSRSDTSTQHYGPYTSTSSDSGTCGNDWATDTFDRHFTVFQNKDGSMAIVEQFKDGSFVTPAPVGDPARSPNGPSPGACQNSATPQGTVNDGITGDLHGYFVIPLPATESQTSTSPYCNATTSSNANCDTTTFIDTHFTPCYGAGTCTVTTFFFHYSAGDQGLVMNEWKNASADRGGNSGDIRSTNI
jgi:hypothetical protein